MEYGRINDEVTLKMTTHEYAELLAFLGALMLTAGEGSMVADECGKFISRMNRTNPDAALYFSMDMEIEAKYGDTPHSGHDNYGKNE